MNKEVLDKLEEIALYYGEKLDGIVRILGSEGCLLCGGNKDMGIGAWVPNEGSIIMPEKEGREYKAFVYLGCGPCRDKDITAFESAIMSFCLAHPERFPELTWAPGYFTVAAGEELKEQ